MAKEKPITAELETAEKIKLEIRRVKPLFKNLDKARKRFAEKMIAELAFMQVTLEELSGEVNTNGAVELFEQGKQKLRRESPALKAYNAVIKSYCTVSKTLVDFLPDSEQEKAGQALMEFARRKK